MKKILARIIMVVVFSAPLLATTKVDLDGGWLFRMDPDQGGETSNWQTRPPSDAHPVHVPHTWNIGSDDGYVGKAWYFKTFEIAAQPADSHVKLHFGATFYLARIWLNGVEIGRHEGGYTAYSFDITRHLQRSNDLAVEIDNRVRADSIPGLAQRGEPNAWYDWWDYGGIVRDVWLTLGGPVQVVRQRIRSEINDSGATVEDQISLENNWPGSKRVSVVATIFGPDNQSAAQQTQSGSLISGAAPITLSLRLLSPKLWNIDRPNMYRIVVDINDFGGSLLDESSDTFGLRKIEIRDRHLLINGARVRLSGVTRHEDSGWEGLAETPGTMLHDYDEMKALQVTLTRPVHYPQNSFILDYADRHGILLIPEIPVWQFSEAQMKNPAVLALARQQMREMIEEAGNHPSIFAWSVCNESDTSTPGGVAYFRAMRDFIRQLDPGRFVSYADDHLPRLQRAEDSAANDADFLMMNQYFGSWHGREDELSAALDRVGRMFPGKMAIISEFGFAGIFAKDPADADRTRVRIISEQMPELAKRDWIAGAILWCYQDYKSRRNLRPGWTTGYVEHGLVDEYRQRKPSYYVWKNLNAPAAIDAHWEQPGGNIPSSFSVLVRPNTSSNLPFYPLYDYRLVWDICGEDGKLLASGEQGFADLTYAQNVSGNLGRQAGVSSLKLHISLLRPSGAIAAEQLLTWHDAGVPGHTAGKLGESAPPAP